MNHELTDHLRPHICLYASFDKSLDADIARGNSQAQINPDVVHHDLQGGRSGGAAIFTAADHGWAEDEFQFDAGPNFPYRKQTFEGSLSLWLKCDPDQNFNAEYPVDPFHISRHAADGSFYLDLTRPNDWRYGSPRKLRWGLYSDNPSQDMFQAGQLLVVGDLHWRDSEWHHVVATWKNANSGTENGSTALYIDGTLRAWMQNYRHDVQWDYENMQIGLGQRFVGSMAELLILDRSLSEDAVVDLFNCT